MRRTVLIASSALLFAAALAAVPAYVHDSRIHADQNTKLTEYQTISTDYHKLHTRIINSITPSHPSHGSRITEADLKLAQELRSRAIAVHAELCRLHTTTWLYSSDPTPEMDLPPMPDIHHRRTASGGMAHRPRVRAVGRYGPSKGTTP